MYYFNIWIIIFVLSSLVDDMIAKCQSLPILPIVNYNYGISYINFKTSFDRTTMTMVPLFLLCTFLYKYQTDKWLSQKYS